jgi:ribosome maturation factor RimP
VASDDLGARVEVDGQPRDLGYAEVTKALVQIEFNRPGDRSNGDAGDTAHGQEA